MLELLKQLLCKHTYEKEYILSEGFQTSDGRIIKPYYYQCTKCGKTDMDRGVQHDYD